MRLIVLFLLLGSISSAWGGDLDHELLSEVSYHYLNPIDSNKIKNLILQGANPNVTDEIGLTPLQWVVIQASNTGLDPSLLDLTEFMLDHGADPNLADFGSQRTALANSLAFVSDPGFKLGNLLLSHGAGLSQRNVFGADLLMEAVRNGHFDVATLFLQRGADPQARDIHGNTVLMVYVRAVKSPISFFSGEPDFLTGLFRELGVSGTRKMLDDPNASGTTPLIEAARFNNIPLVRTLLERGADAKLSDQEGQTPLSIAEREGYTELAAILRPYSPVARAKDPGGIDCQGENPLPLDFEKLQALIQTCGLKSIEQLLPLLPRGLRSSYALVYDSRSLQGASPDYPRVILFGKDAKLILAINGSPTQDRFNSIEAIQFRDSNKQFEFRDIQFDSAIPPVKPPVFSERNPSLCLDCHRYGRLRPNWDQFSMWPGVFGSENGFIHHQEQSFYARYLAHRNEGRYQYLLEHSDELAHVRGVVIQDEDSAAVRFGELLDELNFQSIARELKDDLSLKPYRYALLASLSCDDGEGGITSYLPASLQQSWTTKYAGLEGQLADMEIRGDASKSERQAKLIAGAPEDFRQRESLDGFRSVLDERQKAQLLYLAQASPSIHPLYWSMELNSDHFSFSLDAGGFTILEYDLWKELLDPVADRDLYQTFAARTAQAVANQDFSIFYRRPEAKALCTVLKQKSLSQF